MKRFTGRMLVAALALAVASAPALAGGRGGWGGGYGGGHGYGGGSYHGGYYGGNGYHHHGGGGSSSTGWWVGGAFALAAVGLLLAADSGPTYAQTGVYASPGVAYTSPPVYAAPVYETPPVAYAQPQPQYAPVQYDAAPQVNPAQANATTDCQRWAMNQSGYDPATISQWTTQVMVDSYNHALDSCMTSRGYRAN